MTSPLVDAASPEQRLLVYTARTQMPPAMAHLVRALAEGPLNWNVLIADSVRHCVTPLFARNIFALAPETVPPQNLVYLKNLIQATAARSLLLTGELIRLDAQFRSQGLIPMPYKGPVLAAQAYGNVGLRQFDDLDVILRQRDMPVAHQIMLGLGYQPRFHPELAQSTAGGGVPGEYKYYDSAREIIVELHTEFTLRHFPKIPDLEVFARRLVSVSLGGGHHIHTFAPEDALPILCIHGSKDFWDRLSWIADIAELIRAHSSLEWDQVFHSAETLRAGRMLHLGLLLAGYLFDAPIPNRVVARLRRDSEAATVASAVERRLFDRDHSFLHSATARFTFRRRMMSGILAGWTYGLRLAMEPAEEDWHGGPSPERFAPRNLLLRPLRLLRKHGHLGRRSPRPNL